jgi:hypothetical protein
MAIRFNQYAISTVPTIILSNGLPGQNATIVFTNPSASGTAYLGLGSTLTIANGAPIPPYATILLQNVVGTTPIWAIGDGTATTIGFFYGDLA